MTPPMTEQTATLQQDWRARAVVTFNGARHSNIRTGEDYATLTLADIFAMEPERKDKGSGSAFIPSSYCDFDAREHAKQREIGAFVALCGDVDSGDHDAAKITGLVHRLAGDAAWLIYTSAHSRPGDTRWRIILPLDKAVSFDDWYDAQEAFFACMESAGVQMDHALSRAGQPVYLPNVPAVHTKSGTPLRGDDGETLYYQRASGSMEAPGLDIGATAIGSGIARIRHQRAEDDKERARIRQEAMQRRAQQPQGDGASVIVDFNATNSVGTMLELCGYEQSPRHAEDWRSPKQTGETYATRVIGDKWVSLSASDAGSGLGEKCKSGCFGDAYDLFVHYKHGGDHRVAFRALHAERRAAQPNVIYPPEWVQEAPPYDEMPEWAEWDGGAGEPDYAEAAEVRAEVEDDALGFKLTDWSMDRFSGEAPPIKWLCEGSIPLGVPALFAAMGGVGKSFMALDMALEIAAEVIGGGGERRILGGPIKERGSVVVLGAEDGKDSVHRRLARIDTGDRRARANGKLFVVPLPEVGGPMPLISGSSGEFVQTRQFEALLAQLEQIEDLKLIILDPLQAFITSDITKDPAAGQFMWSAFARICARTGATIIVCHHMRKDGAFKITTADEAREAIRGSTALIDGARATYALWGAAEEDARRVCQEAGTEYAPKRVVHGAVVKANDEHDLDVHTYLRGESGLLADASDAGKRAGQKSVRMTDAQAGQCLAEIDRRWSDGRPFSSAYNAAERYIIAFMIREYGVPKHVAKSQMDDWFHAGFVSTDMVDKKTKMTGLRVAKWPNNKREISGGSAEVQGLSH